MKQLIINADDFGLSTGVSQGIALAAKAGVLTSTTIMGNMPNLSQHLELVSGTNIGLGIHLVLSAGKPVLPPGAVPSLVDGRGCFRRSFHRAVQHAEPREVRREWQAQIEHILSLKVKPTHLDSHHHVHMSPKLTGLAIELAKHYGIKAMRRVTLQDAAREQGWWRAALAASAVWPGARAIARSGLKHPSSLISLTEANLKYALSLPAGIYEIFCHPGLVDEELKMKSSLLGERQAELELLTAPSTGKLLEQAGVKLTTYGVFSA